MSSAGAERSEQNWNQGWGLSGDLGDSLGFLRSLPLSGFRPLTWDDCVGEMKQRQDLVEPVLLTPAAGDVSAAWTGVAMPAPISVARL